MDSLIELLHRYESDDPLQAAFKDRFVDLIRAYPDCLLRTCRPGHLTASAWIVAEQGERFLLHHHRKIGRWLQLGGHADGSADLIAVARKEAQEESGLAQLRLIVPGIFDLDIHLIPARSCDPEHLHFDVRFLLSTPEIEPVCSGESDEVTWLSAGQVRDLVNDESVLRLLRKWESTKDFAGSRF